MTSSKNFRSFDLCAPAAKTSKSPGLITNLNRNYEKGTI